MAALNFSVTASIVPQHQVRIRNNKCLQNVKTLVKSIGISSISTSPHESLQQGNWVKLICGASFEVSTKKNHFPFVSVKLDRDSLQLLGAADWPLGKLVLMLDVVDIRNLSLVYTLAGVDCIDCAADASVVSAVNEGIEAAREIVPLRRPWVMISVNDDEDLHFRKAEFDPEDCPLDCSRPCENVCPANAISLEKGNPTDEVSNSTTHTPGVLMGGVITERCYGCGRCFPVCPYDKIREVTYVRDAAATTELLRRNDVDAVEIHTSGRKADAFKELWNDLGDSAKYLKLIAISLPDLGDSTLPSMDMMYTIMEPQLHCYNLWQLDGRPMSGDIGRGATREAISFAVRLAAAKDRPRGFLQLAGGTNAHTVIGLKREGLFQTAALTKNRKDDTSTVNSPSPLHASINGIAYGGYARKIVGRVLSSMQSQHGNARIEDYPEYLLDALVEALGLVGTVKCYDHDVFYQKP